MAFLYKTSSFCTFFIISSAETLRFLKAGHKYVIFQGGCAVPFRQSVLFAMSALTV